MTPFTLRYSLTRTQRAGELYPWVPAIAGGTGFSVGTAILGVAVSPWFLVLLLLPVVVYPSLFAALLDFALTARREFELVVDDTDIEVRSEGTTRRLPLGGVIQVFRTGDAWTVLHHDRTALLIPASAISAEQVDFLKSFARRGAVERNSAGR